MNIIFLSIAGFVSGILGSMGLGGGGILVIYLTLFLGMEQKTAQGINLIFFSFMALTATIIYSYKKLIDWKLVFPISVFGIVGAIAGFYLSSFLNGNILSKLFGILLLFVGVSQIFKKEN